MKRYFPWIMPLLLLGLLPAVAAQNALDALLQRFPGQNAAETEQLARELLRQGPQAIAAVCGMLHPFSVDDDSQAQFAVNAITVYASRPDVPESDRLIAVNGLMLGLDASQNPEAKGLLIRQLQLCAKNEAVSSLRACLNDAYLCGPAAQALSVIATPDAAQALLAALEESNDTRRLPLIMALGALHCPKSVPALTALAQDADETVQQAAKYALAMIASAPAETKPALPDERQARIERELTGAEALAAQGGKKQAARVCRDTIKALTEPNDAPLRAKALRVLVKIEGAKSLKDMIAAMESPCAAYRNAALNLAPEVSGSSATKQWARALRRMNPEAQAEIAAMLGERGDSAAIPALKRLQKTADPTIQKTIKKALTQLGAKP